MKKFKKIVAAVLASTMVMSAMAVSAFAADTTLALSASGQIRCENDVYRVNLFNSWTGDAGDTIIDPAALNGAVKVTVNFTVTGDMTGTAAINMSNSDWGDVQFWNDGKDYPAVVSTPATLNGAGSYTVTLETTGDYTFDTVAFIAVITDTAKVGADKDLVVTDSGYGMTIDSVVVSDSHDVASGDSTTTTALIVAAVAALAVVATVSTKKVAFQK